jgi:uncharacterized membrane protein (DUF373 family)
MFKNSFHASQKTHCAFLANTGLLLLCREVIVMYTENYTKDMGLHNLCAFTLVSC